MPRALKRYQQTGDLHFLTFSCNPELSIADEKRRNPPLRSEMWGTRFVLLVEIYNKYCNG